MQPPARPPREPDTRGHTPRSWGEWAAATEAAAKTAGENPAAKGETAATTAAVRRTAQRGATTAATAEKDRATKLCRMTLAANPGDPGLLLPLLSGRHHRRPGPSHKHCALHCT